MAAAVIAGGGVLAPTISESESDGVRALGAHLAPEYAAGGRSGHPRRRAGAPGEVPRGQGGGAGVPLAAAASVAGAGARTRAVGRGDGHLGGGVGRRAVAVLLQQRAGAAAVARPSGPSPSRPSWRRSIRWRRASPPARPALTDRRATARPAAAAGGASSTLPRGSCRALAARSLARAVGGASTRRGRTPRAASWTGARSDRTRVRWPHCR